MFVTGPDVVKTVTNETVTAEELGGAVGAYDAGPRLPMAPMTTMSRRCCRCAGLIDLLPQSNTSPVPEIECYQSVTDTDASLDTLVPAQRQQAL